MYRIAYSSTSSTSDPPVSTPSSRRFDVLDSDRDDVDYEDWHGHDLDREMLDLLQRY